MRTVASFKSERNGARALSQLRIRVGKISRYALVPVITGKPWASAQWHSLCRLSLRESSAGRATFAERKATMTNRLCESEWHWASAQRHSL